VDFGFSEEQQKFKQEVRDFCQNEPQGKLTDVRGFSPSFYKRIAEKGWFGLRLPKKYGGQEKDAIYEVIFLEEAGYNRAPITLYGTSVFYFANLILKFGSEQLKSKYLTRIIKGEITGGQAFTEPESGSDLASVQCRAVRSGDYYIVNGNKTFTSLINHTDGFSLLMARTDPDAPLEKGISFLIMDNNTPGINYTPLEVVHEGNTHQVFLDNVKIPKENLLGEENKGWDYFIQTKAYYWNKLRALEVGTMQRIFDNIIQYTEETGSGGSPLCRDAQIRQKLANMAVDIKIMRLLTYQMAWMLTKDLDVFNQGAMLKVFGEQAILRFFDSAMQILGLIGQLGKGEKHAPLGGVMEWEYRRNSNKHFSDGGTIVARNFIAAHVLDLPESLQGGR
jgi:alkylation response protein AidB-like acyl-CoA dehydrogenase